MVSMFLQFQEKLDSFINNNTSHLLKITKLYKNIMLLIVKVKTEHNLNKKKCDELRKVKITTFLH